MTTNLKSVREVAVLLNSAEITLYRLIKARKIPFRKIGSRYLFSDEDVQQYLSASKVEPVVEGGTK
jgi:excisionase family DNA binding protein